MKATPPAPIRIAGHNDAEPQGSYGQLGPDGGQVLSARIGQSIAAIERAAENAVAIRESLTFYKDLADELTQRINEDDREKRELKRLLTEAEQAALAEEARRAHADRHSADLQVTIHLLQDQIEALQSQTEQLVAAVTRLVTSDEPSDEQLDARSKFAA